MHFECTALFVDSNVLFNMRFNVVLMCSLQDSSYIHLKHFQHFDPASPANLPCRLQARFHVGMVSCSGVNVASAQGTPDICAL